MNARFPLRALARSTALGAALAACTAGPDYKGPPAVTLAPYHNQAAATALPASAPPPPLDSWWAGFRDPELTRIVERALAQNLDLAASLGRVEQARAAAAEAGVRLLPSAALSADATAQEQSLDSPTGLLARHAPGYNRYQQVYDIGAGASWEIDLAGGLKRGVEAAGAEAQAAEADRLGVRISVAAEAADSYLQIRGDQARLALVQQQVATDQHLLFLVQQRQKQGVATDRELAEAQALIFQAGAAAPPLRAGIEAQSNRLDVLMGAQPGAYEAELAAPEALPDAPAISAASGPADLFRRRPDVIAAERRLAASTARIGVAMAEYYPKLSLSALLGLDSLGAKNLLTADSFQPEGILGLRWRLFDFGRVDDEVAAARGGDAIALAQYRKSILSATEDVEDALSNLVQSEVQTAQLDGEVKALTEARDKSEEAYRGGVIALTEVLDSDRQLLGAEDQLAETQAATDRAAVASFRALGGGWTADDATGGTAAGGGS